MSPDINRIRQHAVETQEDRMQIHSFAGPKEGEGWVWDLSAASGKGTTTARVLWWSAVKSFVKPVWTASAGAWVGSGMTASGISGGEMWIRLWTRDDRCFLTSLFFMKVIATPIVRLLAWTVLVWSEAWNAVGEKKNYIYCFEHTPDEVRVPAIRSGLGYRSSNHEKRVMLAVIERFSARGI